MTVMRSVFYVPGNNEKLVSKAPSISADIITLDLEDSVPPAEKPKAREVTRENLKSAGSGGSIVYVRINNWETEMTNDDCEAVVHEGLSGICLAKCGGPEHVIRLDWKLEELERRRGLEMGSIAIQLLIETARGVINCPKDEGVDPFAGYRRGIGIDHPSGRLSKELDSDTAYLQASPSL